MFLTAIHRVYLIPHYMFPSLPANLSVRRLSFVFSVGIEVFFEEPRLVFVFPSKLWRDFSPSVSFDALSRGSESSL